MRRALVIVATALPLLATCDSLDNVTVSAEGRSVIPKRSLVDELLGQVAFTGFADFDIEQSQEFRNQGYTKDQIDSVRVRSFALTIAGPASANFDFLSSIRFYVEADGLPRELIAELDTIPVGQGMLVLDVAGDLELQPYVIAPSLTITTQATGMRPPEETTVDAAVAFDIDVNVTGGCD